MKRRKKKKSRQDRLSFGSSDGYERMKFLLLGRVSTIGGVCMIFKRGASYNIHYGYHGDEILLYIISEGCLCFIGLVFLLNI